MREFSKDVTPMFRDIELLERMYRKLEAHDKVTERHWNELHKKLKEIDAATEPLDDEPLDVPCAA